MKKSRRHIAIVLYGGIGTGPPPVDSGIPIILSFVNRLAETNKITVFSFSPINKDFNPDSFQVIAPIRGMGFIKSFVWFFKQFLKEHRSSRIEMIHAIWGFPQGFFAVVAKRYFRIPVIIHLQGGDSTYIPEIKYGAFRSWAHKRIISWAYEQSNELIVLSNYQKRQLEKHFNKKSALVVPFGIAKNSIRSEIRNLNTPIDFIHIGHISLVKDQKMLLKAFSVVSDKVESKLTMIGVDTLSGSLKEYADKLGISERIEFMGLVSHNDVIEILSNAHVLLHTSLYEAQAVAVNEALSKGLVVCGTDVGIISDLSSICTIASPIREAQVLASKILDLLSDEDRYRNLAEQGIKWSLNNTEDHTIEAFRKIYQNSFDEHYQL